MLVGKNLLINTLPRCFLVNTWESRFSRIDLILFKQKKKTSAILHYNYLGTGLDINSFMAEAVII